MTLPEDTSSPEQDQAAIRYCLRVLKEEPDISYKEVRREAWRSEKLTIRRQAWTSARRELGLAVEAAEPEPSERGGPEAPREPGGADSARSPTREPRPYPPREDRSRFGPPSQGRDFERPSWSDRTGAAARTSDDEGSFYGEPSRPAPPRRDESGDQERRRPAWATPARPTGAPAPQTPAWASPPPYAQPPAPAWQAPPPPLVAPSADAAALARSAIEFMVHYLTTINRDASFQDVKEAAEKRGFTVYPATFGRAQAIAGIVEAGAAPVVRREPVREAPATPTPAGPAPVAPSTAPTTAPAIAASPAPAAAPATPKRVLATEPETIDPVAGLTAYFVAFDRLDAERVRLRAQAAEMLDVVQQALRPL